MSREPFFALLLPLIGTMSLIGCADERSPREQVEILEIAAADGGEAPVNQFGFMEAMEQGPVLFESGGDAARDAAASAAADVAMTTGDASEPPADAQIAYTYSWGFAVDAGDLPILQERHRSLCLSLGENCRILSLSQSGNGDYAYGRVRMQVAAERAEEFGQALTLAGEELDAEQVSFAISGEDLTDDIIDTEAHLAARRLLRDRLMDVLRSRQGSVGDLVAAERGVAEVNEEIDAATSRLENMRNRITYSNITIEYDPEMGQYNVGFWAPIAYAFGAVGSTLGVVIAGLIYLAVALVPISLFALGLRWLWRRARRWRNRRTNDAAEAA